MRFGPESFEPEFFTKDAIQRREISSLDSSPLYESLEAKKRSLLKKKKLAIPAYPITPTYRSGILKRVYSRGRYFSALIRQKLSGREYPIIAIIVVNNKCNWNCTYCFGDYPNRKEIDYTTDELKYLVDELYGMGVRYINVHGGEALLRPDIGEVCHYIKNKGMYLCVITNGALLPKKIAELRCVDNLTLSLDGALDGNDRNRGKGTFAITLNAIELALAEKIPLRVQATLTRHTMGDIGFLAELARQMNFHLQFSILFKPLKKASDFQMSPHEIRSAVEKIGKYRQKGYPIFTSQKVLNATYEWPYHFHEKHHITEEEIPASYRPHQIECFYSRTKFTIEADGYVYPCFLTTDGSFTPQNWKEVGVQAAIDHVQQTNRCRACPAMTQNDHNLLLGMNLPQVAHLIKNQWRETFRIRSRIKE